MYLPPPECEACRTPIDPTPGPVGQGRWCMLCAPAGNPLGAATLAALFPSWFGVVAMNVLSMLLSHFRQAMRVLQSLVFYRTLVANRLEGSGVGEPHTVLWLGDVSGQIRAQQRHVDFLQDAVVSAVLA